MLARWSRLARSGTWRVCARRMAAVSASGRPSHRSASGEHDLDHIASDLALHGFGDLGRDVRPERRRDSTRLTLWIGKLEHDRRSPGEVLQDLGDPLEDLDGTLVGHGLTKTNHEFDRSGTRARG